MNKVKRLEERCDALVQEVNAVKAKLAAKEHAALPLYSGDESRCPQCGKVGDATSAYSGSVHPILRRSCNRCGAYWNERPLSAGPV